MDNQKWAAGWAAGIRELNPLFLDTETTGIGPGVEPIQIAVIDSDETILFNSPIRPVVAHIQPDAFAVHGIKPSDLVDSPTLADVHGLLVDILRDRTVVVYNARYDAAVLGYACYVNKVDNISEMVKWVDLMNPYAVFYGDLKRNGEYRWQKLTAACQQQEIEVMDAHSALGDCRMAVALFNRLAEQGQ